MQTSTSRSKRNFKDSLFRALFKRKKEFLSLYNALSGKNLTDPRLLKANTLASALYTTQRNDISFQIGDRFIVLVEEQSSVNGNMPLRMLMYLSELYRRSVPKEALYQRQTQKLPAPEFFVLYVGDENVPLKEDLRLSDAFDGGNQDIELVTHLYNITATKENPVLEKCRTLYEYSEFVHQVESRRKSGIARDDAIHSAIAHCIKNNILSIFLKKYEMEVYDMVSMKWDLDTALDVRGAEERQAGLEEGIRQGMERGMERGLTQGQEKERLHNIRTLMKNTGATAEKVMAMLGIEKSQMGKYLALL